MLVHVKRDELLAIAAQTGHIYQPQVTGVALPQEALLHLTQDILRQ